MLNKKSTLTTRIQTTVLGYPRIGRNRELKRATEAYWAGKISADALLSTGTMLRRQNWERMAASGLTEIPVNDFSFYDQVADLIQLFGVVPERHRISVPDDATSTERRHIALNEYFAMGRGTDTAAPLEMTKWFDTNYHCLIPELTAQTVFQLSGDKPIAELLEAQALGVHGRPVLVGPVTFLELAKPAPGSAMDFKPLDLLERLLPIYALLLAQLTSNGAEWVQLDEPILCTDPRPEVLTALERTLTYLGGLADRPKLLIATYFGTVEEALPILQQAPVEGMALDFTRYAHRNLALLTDNGGLPGKRLVAGVVNGRNVWINNLSDSLSTLTALRVQVGELVVSTSCSLLHVPQDVRLETDLDPEVTSWLAFAEQKLVEVVTLAQALNEGTEAIAQELALNQEHLTSRRNSPLVNDPIVRTRMAAVTADDLRRPHPAVDRIAAQQGRLDLPILPTTTIGSFPQTDALRTARAELGQGTINSEQYESRIADEIKHVIELQESLGLDVLVHGEAERNDMVQYFAEQLHGFLSTKHGWVQSYGTRCVRPPILAGDVSRPEPMTVRWTKYAQGLTDRPMKGMLTGPVTMLAWSFVRDDQPLAESALQVAWALRDEVTDLAATGITIIQVDEPALRETLPLRRSDHADYLRWAVEAFRLTTSSVSDEIQIHTHMCYAEFGEIMTAIEAMDVDVISLEAARSHMEINHELTRSGHTYAVGSGVYDIHAPRIPSVEEIVGQLRNTITYIPFARLWVNPDCGLKTRTETQVAQALENMVAAAHKVREEIAGTSHNK